MKGERAGPRGSSCFGKLELSVGSWLMRVKSTMSRVWLEIETFFASFLLLRCICREATRLHSRLTKGDETLLPQVLWIERRGYGVFCGFSLEASESKRRQERSNAEIPRDFGRAWQGPDFSARAEWRSKGRRSMPLTFRIEAPKSVATLSGSLAHPTPLLRQEGEKKLSKSIWKVSSGEPAGFLSFVCCTQCVKKTKQLGKWIWLFRGRMPLAAAPAECSIASDSQSAGDGAGQELLQEA